MPLHIAIDARRLNDFGVGTYIRNLVLALGGVDPHNHYTLIISPSDLRELPARGKTWDSCVERHAPFPFSANSDRSSMARER